MSRRAERLNREIVKKLGTILNQQDWPAERVTVVSADTSSKFDYVRVYISVWPEGSEKATVQAINAQKGLIKKELGAKLKMRLIPEIGFYSDRSTEASVRIAELLKKAEQE
jgi:ribosome-binding factor A